MVSALQRLATVVVQIRSPIMQEPELAFIHSFEWPNMLTPVSAPPQGDSLLNWTMGYVTHVYVPRHALRQAARVILNTPYVLGSYISIICGVLILFKHRLLPCRLRIRLKNK